MRFLKLVPIVFCAAMLLTVIAPGARADQWDKKSIVTFDNPVQIPGQVLEPGTYIFKLVDFPFTRNVVQIWTGDEDHMVAMVLTTPDDQPQAGDKSIFVLQPSSGRANPTLESWFFAGETSGLSFIYPEYPTNESTMNRSPAQ